MAGRRTEDEETRKNEEQATATRETSFPFLCQRGRGPAFFGEAVFLEAAVGLVGDGHFNKSITEQGIKNLVPELGAVAASRQFQQLAQWGFVQALPQDFDLVPTWCQFPRYAMGVVPRANLKV